MSRTGERTGSIDPRPFTVVRKGLDHLRERTSEEVLVLLDESWSPGSLAELTTQIVPLVSAQGQSLVLVMTTEFIYAHAAALDPIFAACEEKGTHVTVEIVLGDEADGCAVFDQDPIQFARICKCCRRRIAKRLAVRWLIPLRAPLIYRLEGLFSLARDEGFDAVLLPEEGIPALAVTKASELTTNDRQFIWDFVTYRLLDEEAARIPPHRLRMYQQLRDTIRIPGARPESATEETAVVFSRSDGGWKGTDWSWPSFSVERCGLPGARRRPTQQTRRWSAVPAQFAEVGGVLSDGLRAVVHWAWTGLRKRRGTALPPGTQLQTVMVVGAYGGEHIGDAAILGGVLLRVRERFGIARVVLMSQRPGHTRHLIPMLDLPLEISVERYEHDRIRAVLSGVDALVYGGGPLIDIPKQLVRHLYAASLARRWGKPFIIEGIGAGPFVRSESQWFGRRILKLADSLSVRTEEDAHRPFISDLAPVAKRDPAFDYLDTRRETLTRIPPAEIGEMDAILEGTDGRPVIGVNVRPIRPEYTEGAGDRDPAEYTRWVEARFEQRLADGMKQYHAQSATKPCFIFYPMNAIQFGLSDLRSAYRIKRLIGGEVDFRIWEADVSLDGVVAFLRRIDLVIAMRFHAAIFALSQGLPVIGIDYRIGKRDKVAALLEDFGHSDRCLRIDQVTEEWVAAQLTQVIEGLGAENDAS